MDGSQRRLSPSPPLRLGRGFAVFGVRDGSQRCWKIRLSPSPPLRLGRGGAFAISGLLEVGGLGWG